MRQLSHTRRSRLCDEDLRALYTCRLASSARAHGTARAGLVSRTRKASPGTCGRFSPAFSIAWKVHSRRGASCAPRRDLDTCQFVPGGSRQRPVLPSLTVSPRGAGQARRAHGSCISIQCIRLLSLTPRRPFYRERWAAPVRHVDMSKPGQYPGEGKGLINTSAGSVSFRLKVMFAYAGHAHTAGLVHPHHTN